MVEKDRVEDEYIVSMSDAIAIPVLPISSQLLKASPTNDSYHAVCFRGIAGYSSNFGHFAFLSPPLGA